MNRPEPSNQLPYTVTVLPNDRVRVTDTRTGETQEFSREEVRKIWEEEMEEMGIRPNTATRGA